MPLSFFVFVLLSIFVILALTVGDVAALVAPGSGPSVPPLSVNAAMSPQLLNGSLAGGYRNMSVADMGGKYCSRSCSCHYAHLVSTDSNRHPFSLSSHSSRVT